MKRQRILQAPMVLAGLPFIAGLYPRVTGSIESWGPDDAQSQCHTWDTCGSERATRRRMVVRLISARGRVLLTERS